MTLRLVLVGIVVALGVTIPKRSECERGFADATTWTRSALARWDTWRPSEGSGNLRGPRECPLCRIARAELARKSRNPATDLRAGSTAAVVRPARPSPGRPDGDGSLAKTAGPATSRGVAFEPITVPDDSDTDIALKLNREAEGIDLTQPPAPPVQSMAAREPIGRSENLELALLDELSQAVDEGKAGSGSCERDSKRSSQTQPPPAQLASEQPSGKVTAPTTASSAEGIPWPVFAPAGPTAPAPIAVAREASIPWPVFAPGGPPPEPDRSVTAQSTGASTHPVRWGEAIQLTREAVVAWMKVLTGPALVQVSAR
jgi:hypothetical protein